nr:lipocalin family protein [Mesorhizobium sediminum]
MLRRRRAAFSGNRSGAPVDDAKSRLKVTFLPEHVRWIPFTKGDYWVLKIDPGYRTAFVGTPDRKYLWILSRQPQISETIKDEYLAEARQQSFDLTNLITPRHTGSEVTDGMLRGTRGRLGCHPAGAHWRSE